MWGKIFGSFAGFAMGGPIGAMFGAAAGHAYDKVHDSITDQFAPSGAGPTGAHGFASGAGDAAQQMAFSIAVIVLGAKVAKVDGAVNRREIDAFKEVFQIPSGEQKSIARIFDAAKQEAEGFEPYARQLGQLLRNQRSTLENLLSGLFHIARADGSIKPVELSFLRRTSDLFGLEASTFERIRQNFMQSAQTSPYAVLGLDHTASDDEVKRTYRRLIREHHPDTHIARGVASHFVETATQKMATINAAYDQIGRERGMK